MKKIIRVYITENCNSKCSNCFNARERGNSLIDVQHFEEICHYFSSNGVSTIKVMGGEPTIHPNFSDIMAIAQEYFTAVFLFTNGINNNVFEFKPRETDAIIYNFRFSKVLTADKLLLDKPGRRSLEVQITSKTNEIKLIDEILSRCGNYKERINPCLTLDCTENIFTNREKLIEKYSKVWNACQKAGFIMGQDHIPPLCFIYGSDIKMPSSGCICDSNCIGLIDAKFNIKFCNQYSQSLGNLYKDDTLIPFMEYLDMLSKEQENLQDIVKEKICDKCPFYQKYCNGGCFMAKDFIDRDSVIINSQMSSLFLN